MMKSLGAMNLSTEAMDALRTVKDDRQLFRNTLSSTLNSYAKNRGLNDLQLNNLKVKYSVYEKLETQRALLASTGQKIPKELSGQVNKIQLDIAKIIGGEPTTNLNSGQQAIRSKAIKILSKVK